MEVVDANAGQPDVRRTLRMLWRRKWLIVFPVLLAVLLALVLAMHADKIYKGSARARYADPAGSSLFGTGTVRVQSPEAQAATEKEAARAPQVQEELAKMLGPEASRVRSLGVSAPSDGSAVLIFTASSTSPRVAADAATGYAKAYVAVERRNFDDDMQSRVDELRKFADDNSQKAKELDGRIAGIDAQIADLQAQIVAASGPPGTPQNQAAAPDKRAQVSTLTTQRQQLANQRDSLTRSEQESRTRADQLSIEANLQSASGGDLISASTVASRPVSPTPAKDAEVAALFGLMLGIGLAFGRDYFDDRIHGPSDVSSIAPLLATVPSLKSAKSAPLVTLRASHSREAEAYRSLRASVEFADIETPTQILLVTSAAESEGKSTTAANLAGALASSGARVVLVDLDLRRPCLDRLFNVENEPGLSGWLLGKATLDECLQVVTDVPAGELLLLPTGLLPPHPGEIVGSQRIGTLLSELRQRADYVIVDSPPVLPVTDVLSASRWIDAIVLVVRANSSRQRQVRAALDRLDQTPAPVLGVVLNGIDGAEAGYYYQRSTYYRRPKRTRDVVVAPIEDWKAVLDDNRPTAANRGTAGNGSGSNGNGVSHRPARRV